MQVVLDGCGLSFCSNEGIKDFPKRRRGLKKAFLRHMFLLVLLVPFITLSCGSVTAPEVGLNIIATASQQTAGSTTFRIGVENTGLKTETLSFGNGQFFDIEVRDRGGRLVWQYSHDAYFLDVLWSIELAPGESQVREFVWTHMGNDQKPLSSGSYRATVYITNSPRDEGLLKVVSLTI